MENIILFNKKFKGLLICSVLACVVLCASPALVSAQETTINKVDVNSTIEIRTIAANYDETTYIKGTLKDQKGNAIGGVELDITVNNKYYNKQTNSKGQWEEISTQLSPGENIITVSLKGHPYYNDFTNQTTINVNNKTNINSTIQKSGSFKYEPMFISGYLTNKNKERIPNEYVTLTVTYSYSSMKEVFYLKTNNNGYWYIEYIPYKNNSSGKDDYCYFEVSLKDHPLYNNFSKKAKYNIYYDEFRSL